ncbi:MAG: DMT family transporter [Oscillospiraceae bacterium]|nr:DMT family transporter [Oscillospiraceae bacterium]
MGKGKKTTYALIAAFLGYAIFGFSFMFSKLALETATPFVLLGVRFLIAFIALNLVILVMHLLNLAGVCGGFGFSLKNKPVGILLLLGLTEPVLYFICENYGIELSSSAFAGTIIALIPVAAIVLDLTVMHERVSTLQIVCAGLSVVGVLLTALGSVMQGFSIWGLVLLLGAVFSGALFGALSRKASVNFNPIEKTWVMFAMGAVVFVAMGLIQSAGDFENRVMVPLSTGSFWMSAVYLAVASSVVAFLLLNFATEYITVTQFSLFINVTTVISILAGVFIRGEPFAWYQMIGAAIIILCVYVSSVRAGKTAAPEEN